MFTDVPGLDAAITHIICKYGAWGGGFFLHLPPVTTVCSTERREVLGNSSSAPRYIANRQSCRNVTVLGQEPGHNYQSHDGCNLQEVTESCGGGGQSVNRWESFLCGGWRICEKAGRRDL